MARSRLTLDLSPRMSQALARSAERRNCTKAHALRGALELLLAADEAKQEGLHVGAWKQEGDTRIEREFVVGI